MSREWKPGDVGQCNYGRVFYTTDGWHFDDGSGPCGTHTPPAGLHPLVVIDPEDREQVERLMNAVLAPINDRILTAGVKKAQAALREFANPTDPKPAEPTGLGAVVEDAEGCQWVRTQSAVLPWFGTPDATDRKCFGHKRYADLSAVRVLSEGVSA